MADAILDDATERANARVEPLEKLISARMSTLRDVPRIIELLSIAARRNVRALLTEKARKQSQYRSQKKAAKKAAKKAKKTAATKVMNQLATAPATPTAKKSVKAGAQTPKRPGTNIPEGYDPTLFTPTSKKLKRAGGETPKKATPGKRALGTPARATGSGFGSPAKAQRPSSTPHRRG